MKKRILSTKVSYQNWLLKRREGTICCKKWCNSISKVKCELCPLICACKRRNGVPLFYWSLTCFHIVCGISITSLYTAMSDPFGPIKYYIVESHTQCFFSRARCLMVLSSWIVDLTWAQVVMCPVSTLVIFTSCRRFA